MRQDPRWASYRNTRQQAQWPCKYMHAWQSLGDRWASVWPSQTWTHTGGSDGAAAETAGAGGGAHRKAAPAPPPPPGGLLLPLEPILAAPGQLLDLSSQKRIAGLQAVNFVNKLLQNKSICIDIIIEHIKELLEFFKEFRIFKNYYKVAKQILTGLQREIRFKLNFFIQWKRTLYSYEA